LLLVLLLAAAPNVKGNWLPLKAIVRHSVCVGVCVRYLCDSVKLVEMMRTASTLRGFKDQMCVCV
jgi:hypothetical protein